MPIVTFGINHKTAPIDVREKLALHPGHVGETLRAICGSGAANEAVILSTCNRTELYAEAARVRELVKWLTRRMPYAFDQAVFDREVAEKGAPVDDVHSGTSGGKYKKSYFYTHYGEAAVRHMMRVASGLDSMVLGEPQIFGQMKQAFTLAQETGAVGKRFEQLFPTIFSVTKQIRTDTAVGSHSLSMPYAILQLARQIFSDVRQCNALLIGAGQTISLVATYLHTQGVRQITVANRSLHRAEGIAERFGFHPIGMADIPAYLPKADILVSATSSELPILGKGMVEEALKQRRYRPMFMADLAVPRDIEPQIGALEGAYLYDIDDLQGILADNRKVKTVATQQAEAMIQLQSAHFMRQLQMDDVVEVISNYRANAEKVGRDAIDSVMKMAGVGDLSEYAVEKVIRQLTNKMIHLPTIEMRKAAYAGNMDYLQLLAMLFTPKSEEEMN